MPPVDVAADGGGQEQGAVHTVRPRRVRLGRTVCRSQRARTTVSSWSGHAVASYSRAVASLSSADRRQRVFTAVHSVMYRQRASGLEGSHSARVLVRLLAVLPHGHGGQGAGVVEVIGVCLSLPRRPCERAAVPGLGERHHVVDVQAAGVRLVGVVVVAVPQAAADGAPWAECRGNDSFVDQHFGPRITPVAIRVHPVLELVTFVAVPGLVGDRQIIDCLPQRRGHSVWLCRRCGG